MAAIDLSKAERTILANQYKILSIIDPDNLAEYNNNMEILELGYVGFYPQIVKCEAEISYEVYKETHRILTMFRDINVSKQALVKAEGDRFNALTFVGFDGNHDPHYHLAKFMVEKQNLYEELRDADLNSHSQASIESYRRMEHVYQKLNKKNGILDANGLQQLLDVMNP